MFRNDIYSIAFTGRRRRRHARTEIRDPLWNVVFEPSNVAAAKAAHILVNAVRLMIG
jgi:hypothetical protein